MAYEAKILKDSVSPDGVRLTTMEVTFPRIVLAEFNTHRVFSRNSASSRAIPIEKMLAKVENDPFVPIYWGKNQKGMQAEEEFSEHEGEGLRLQWLRARDHAVFHAKSLLATGVHKQITNRLLEPWLWHTVIVTSTEWDNFWGLRCNPMAQPEIQFVARMMKKIYDESTPERLDYGDWHLPLVQDDEAWPTDGITYFTIDNVVKVCVGRCARVSYLTHDGKRDPRADIELCERLQKAGHMSPMEHCARPMTSADAQDIVLSQLESCGTMMPDVNPRNVFCGNFRGWVQSRKEMPNEDNFLKAQDLELKDSKE